MTQPAKSQEPSMEEILASIRRIIADDDASKLTQRDVELPKAAVPLAALAPAPEPSGSGIRTEAAAPVGGGNVEDQASDILDLTESMAAPALNQSRPLSASAPAPQFRKIDGHADVSFDETMEKPADVRGHPARAADQRSEYVRARLLSSETSAAVDSAFNALAQTVLVQNGRTLEDLVREMLRPMLKTWLDENLPGMVERLVRAEIERVSRGHG